jgi:hypothetical protein
MLSRGVVSFCALAIVLIGVFFVVMSGVWETQGRLGFGEMIFMLGGWLLVTLFFAWRALDPDYLDPQSIVKRR